MHPRTRELLDYVNQQRKVLRAAFDTVPPSMRDRSPASGRWSTAGVIEHLAIVETRGAGRLSVRIAEVRAEGLGAELSTDPVLPTLNVTRVIDRTARFTAPDALQPTGLGADAAWASLEQAGGAIRDAFKAGDGLALGTVSIPHPAFGPISLYQYFAFMGAHEARHAAQIHEIAEALAPQP